MFDACSKKIDLIRLFPLSQPWKNSWALAFNTHNTVIKLTWFGVLSANLATLGAVYAKFRQDRRNSHERYIHI